MPGFARESRFRRRIDGQVKIPTARNEVVAVGAVFPVATYFSASYLHTFFVHTFRIVTSLTAIHSKQGIIANVATRGINLDVWPNFCSQHACSATEFGCALNEVTNMTISADEVKTYLTVNIGILHTFGNYRFHSGVRINCMEHTIHNVAYSTPVIDSTDGNAPTMIPTTAHIHY
jgi:hypothetical protein